MPVIGNKELNKEAELTAMRRAIAVERRAYYADFQGRQTTFSNFMRNTANKLCRKYPAETSWATIQALFQQYRNVDVASRIALVKRAEELMAPFFKLQAEALQRQQAEQEQLQHEENEQEEHERARCEQEDHEQQVEPPTSSTLPKSNPAASKSRAVDVKSESPAATAARQSNVTNSLKSAQPTDGGKAINNQQKFAQRSPQPPEDLEELEEQLKSDQTTEPGKLNDSNKANASDKVNQTDNVTEPGKTNSTHKTEPAGKKESGAGIAASVQFVKGVGPKFAAVLSGFGIDTVEDLLRHYPRRHLDFQNRSYIKALQPGQEVTIFGVIRTTNAHQLRNKNMSILTVTIGDGTGNLNITKFIGGKSNKYLLDRYKNQYPKGAQVLASGIAERDKYSNRMTLKNSEIEVLGFTSEAEEDVFDSATATIHAGRLVPVYPVTEGLSLRHLRNIIFNAIEGYSKDIKDPLPDSLRQELNLFDLKSAYEQIHFPKDLDSFELARRRLVFDELFSIQLQLAHRRYKFDQSEGALQIVHKEGGLVDQLIQHLPFTLTGAQNRVFGDIARDLSSAKPMHRLVQGDVGSGKTVVALLACMIAIENGFQAVMMAPTEILAEQHFRQFQRLITPLGLRCCLVLGKQGQKERREIRQQMLAGQINIAVGTHALIEDNVEFDNLGLIIIDEQHRFGVKQRARLKAKSQSPELLTMTATPIPRTLALTMHGDLDVSEIDELPPGRKPIKTKIVTPGKRRDLNEFIRKEIDAGRQAYIVFPLIEESESLAAKAATQEFERLKEEKIFAGLGIGLMHGKLKSQEKDDVMDRFRQGEFQILVCTTVIEVGVDVPNSTVMVIENADRFGLSQLHQLRGRVGRGGEQSYCFLVADAKGETTRQRLAIMEQTNDGFVIAEKDLELRGPGEFMGYKQSGLPDMVLADLIQDAKVLEEARNAAIALIKEDAELTKYPGIKEILERKTSSLEPEVLRTG